MDDLPARTVNLPADLYPFTVELLDADTRKTVWSATADEPSAMRIPSKDELGVRAVAVRVLFADGTVTRGGGPEVMTPAVDIPPGERRRNYGWFGPPWWSYVCYAEDGTLMEEMRKPFPAGEMCMYCDTLFDETAGHSGRAMPLMQADRTWVVRHVHKECLLMSVLGPLAHYERRCPCYGGTSNRTAGMTRWEEAQELWRRHHAGTLTTPAEGTP